MENIAIEQLIKYFISAAVTAFGAYVVKTLKQILGTFKDIKTNKEDLNEFKTDIKADIAGLKQSTDQLCADFKINNAGTLTLLQAKLVNYYKDYVLNGDGWISKDDLETALNVYKAYHALGGNGIGTRYIEEIQKLKIK